MLAVAIVAGIALGTVAVSPADTVAILAHKLLGWPVAQGWPATAETIVMELRLPRVLTALVVGFGLAVAGTTFQGLLRNPLADPYVLGTASGAALGAAIGGRAARPGRRARARPRQPPGLRRRAARGRPRAPPRWRWRAAPR